MEKRKIKNRLTSLFTALIIMIGMLALLIFSATPKPVSPLAASAATSDKPYTDYPSGDGHLSWLSGAALDPNTLNRMKFSLIISNADLLSLDNGEVAQYDFTIVRDSEKGQVPIFKLRLMCAQTSNGTMLLTGHQSLTVGNAAVSDTELKRGAIYFNPDQTMIDGAVVVNEGNYKNFGKFESTLYSQWRDKIMAKDDFTMDELIIHRQEETFRSIEQGGYTTLGVVIEVNSYYTDYFVLCNYRAELNTKTTYDGDIKSSSRSVKTILTNMQAAGKLEAELADNDGMLELATEILDETEEKVVTVAYLEQIGETPFAQRIEKTVTLPVLKDSIQYDDVCVALGVESLNCLGASVKTFTRNAEGTYEAEYLSSVRMVARTTDGNGTEYVLKLENSYQEYADELVMAGLVEQGLMEVVLNDIKNKYNNVTIKRLTGEEIYGIWGFVGIPKTTSVSSLMNELFDTETYFDGTMYYQEFEARYSEAAYNVLLEEYGYGYLQEVVNKIKTFFTGQDPIVTHYVFYADPSTKEVKIGENGADSDASIFEQETKELANETVNALTEMYEDAKSGISDTLRGVLIFVAVTTVIALIVGIIAGIIYLRNGGGGWASMLMGGAGGKRR